MTYTLNSIAGYETEKRELERLCEIFSDRGKYEQLGARLPKGVIFYGEAGTGKTLFAKVLASRCGLDVLKIDLGHIERASDTCKLIKKVFSRAKKKKEPTMIFFDELDKVLPNDREEYYSDHSKAVLTQLLTLIDGMDTNGRVVFVATCNSYGTLPETVVRSGRIDKKISIGMPNLDSRMKIIEMYISKSLCEFELTPQEMAQMTGGLSCADLETLINECVLRSENAKVNEYIVKSVISEIRNENISRERSLKRDTIVACSNVGAFVIARRFNDGEYNLTLDDYTVCNHFFDSLISDYDESFGSDIDDDAECEIYSVEETENALCALCGARVAQKEILGTSYDCLEDYTFAISYIPYRNVTCGMYGTEYLYSDSREMHEIRYSSEKIDMINEKIEDIIAEASERAQTIIEDNRELVKALITALVSRKSLCRAECERIIASYGGIK